jgi:hypothetical protein
MQLPIPDKGRLFVPLLGIPLGVAHLRDSLVNGFLPLVVPSGNQSSSTAKAKKAGQGFHPARQIVSVYCEVCRSLSNLNLPAQDFYSGECNP